MTLNDFFIMCSLLKIELPSILKALISGLGWLILYLTPYFQCFEPEVSSSQIKGPWMLQLCAKSQWDLEAHQALYNMLVKVAALRSLS